MLMELINYQSFNESQLRVLGKISTLFKRKGEIKNEGKRIRDKYKSCKRKYC